MLPRMSQAQRKPMTPAEFLDWEAQQEAKWEFDGFEPVAMAGGSVAHAAVQRNLIIALGNRLRGKPCQPYGPDLRVPTAGSRRFRYPDALVTCKPLPADAMEAPEPTILFEVLSPSTEKEDRGPKLEEYLTLPALRRYVMLRYDRAHATVYERSADGWLLRFEHRPGAALTMPEVGIATLPLDELYADVPMPAAGDETTSVPDVEPM